MRNTLCVNVDEQTADLAITRRSLKALRHDDGDACECPQELIQTVPSHEMSRRRKITVTVDQAESVWSCAFDTSFESDRSSWLDLAALKLLGRRAERMSDYLVLTELAGARFSTKCPLWIIERIAERRAIQRAAENYASSRSTSSPV